MRRIVVGGCLGRGPLVRGFLVVCLLVLGGTVAISSCVLVWGRGPALNLYCHYSSAYVSCQVPMVSITRICYTLW